MAIITIPPPPQERPSICLLHFYFFIFHKMQMPSSEMSALGSDGGGGLTSLQRPCLYQTVIRLILIREYLCLHPSCPPTHPPQATRQQEPWQLKNGKLSSSISRPVWWPLKKTHAHTQTPTHPHYAWQ